MANAVERSKSGKGDRTERRVEILGSKWNFNRVITLHTHHIKAIS